jgi:hypothetical protein
VLGDGYRRIWIPEVSSPPSPLPLSLSPPLPPLSPLPCVCPALLSPARGSRPWLRGRPSSRVWLPRPPVARLPSPPPPAWLPRPPARLPRPSAWPTRRPCARPSWPPDARLPGPCAWPLGPLRAVVPAPARGPFTTSLLIIFGGPYYFRRPTPSRRKLSAIFGGLTWPREIRLFSVASDTAAENSLVFGVPLTQPPKISLLKTVGPFFFSVFSLSSPKSAGAVAHHPGRAACLPAPAPPAAQPCRYSPWPPPPALALSRPPRRAARLPCCPSLRAATPPSSSSHRIERYFLRSLFLIFSGCYLVAAEISIICKCLFD